MKIAFNEGTTFESATLEQNLEYCEKYGYDYIEIRTIDQLKDYLQTHTLDDLKRYFDTHKIKPLSLNAICFFNNRTEEDEKEIFTEFKDYLAICQKLECEYICAVPSNIDVTEKGKTKVAEINESAVRVLREFADLAKPYGVKIALEFIGIPENTIHTFKHAYQIVEQVNRDNVGLVYDTFQFTGMGSRFSDVEKHMADKIFIFHINDVDDYPTGQMRDTDRIWPGYGVIDLKRHLQLLKDLNYDFVASIELFRPEYYQMKPEEVIRKAKETTEEVIQKYFR
ncbi:sugar phosphate isomerase/epimerase family protein [Listeria fleischmannii]|uniref:sugar phosphate isomerase/epimerase family protein n=1 Tax=Listeria fleischmannii TaxID=1069827 RepID=UPI000254F4C9|nr:sugar phosphate isomerase/epimerase [Listeria fleischmannii]EIA18878.1 IolI [Listeria fleischmannii subsp. coloradonensis]STY34763.1 Inosose isomerase [Listeria fleischmannii subsp. coloradonensis]